MGFKCRLQRQNNCSHKILLFFRPYFQYSQLDWVRLAVAISDGSNGGIGYTNIMDMDMCEISMIYDTMCLRQERQERDMKSKGK